MKNKKEESKKDDQNFWNIIYTILFITIYIELAQILIIARGSIPTSISFFDLSLITLATFRLTRLFVYDKMTRFVRDIFTPVDKDNNNGPLRTIHDILSCPWCFGVWAATMVTFFYFLTPLAWLPILILAVAGLSSFIQLTANMIGWTAENGKIKANKG